MEGKNTSSSCLQSQRHSRWRRGALTAAALAWKKTPQAAGAGARAVSSAETASAWRGIGVRNGGWPRIFIASASRKSMAWHARRSYRSVAACGDGHVRVFIILAEENIFRRAWAMLDACIINGTEKTPWQNSPFGWRLVKIFGALRRAAAMCLSMFRRRPCAAWRRARGAAARRHLRQRQGLFITGAALALPGAGGVQWHQRRGGGASLRRLAFWANIRRIARRRRRL